MEGAAGRADRPDGRGGWAVDGAEGAPSRNVAYDDVFPLPYDYWKEDEEEADSDEDDYFDVDDLSEKVERIATVYSAMKTMRTSSQLKTHVMSSTELYTTLEKRGFSIAVLKKLCLHDQKFAIAVHDDERLKSTVFRLKSHVEGSERKFPDSTALKWASVAFDNKVDLIDSKRVFLYHLLEDLKKDDALLRRHAVEYILHFNSLVDDASKFQEQLTVQPPPKVGKFIAHRARMNAILKELEAFVEYELSGPVFAAARRYIQTTWNVASLSSAQDGESGAAMPASQGGGEQMGEAQKKKARVAG